MWKSKRAWDGFEMSLEVVEGWEWAERSREEQPFSFALAPSAVRRILLISKVCGTVISPGL